MSVSFGLQYSDSLTVLLLYQNVDTTYLERFSKYETWMFNQFYAIKVFLPAQTRSRK